MSVVDAVPSRVRSWRFISFRLFLLVLVLVAVELAILIPVIVTQRAKDEALVGVQLQSVTNAFAAAARKTVASFVYNVVRAAAAAPLSGFLSQQAMEDAIQPEKDPINTPATQYFWLPHVSAAERTAYEAFYGFNVSQLLNGTGSPVMPIPRNSNLTHFFPYTLFVPPLRGFLFSGLDLLPYNVSTTSVLFKNASEFLSIPSSLIASNRTFNNYGFVAVAQNKYNRGYMFGRIGSKDLLEFSLSVPREHVRLAAYVTTTKNTTRQALFFDNLPELANATTVAAFDACPLRQNFYTASFTSYGETILVAIEFSFSYAETYAGTTWIILAVVLGPVCFLIDVIVVILAALWQRRKKLLLFERRKRQEAQVMISYVNHGENSTFVWELGFPTFCFQRFEIRCKRF